MSDEFYDEDGFRLEFEDDTADQEKQFFMRAFPNVNKIAERKVHCTSCYMHIGTAPITEAVIRMHPILRVTHCRNCHTFYNSGEFDKGEDGSELYCRWCGQGGEVYCCSKCPYVFCKKCIVQNLSRACVQDISRNDNWQCFSCAPKIMWHLRAQHWALVNYIEKQKKDMKDKNLSVQTINNLMKQDNTTCCSNKGLNKKAVTPVSAKKGTKRPSDAGEITAPGAAKIPDNKRILPRPIMPVQQSAATPPAPKKVKTDNNEVVCTPDIMSMFMNPEEPPPLVATRTPPVAKPPAPKPTPAPTIPGQVPGRQVVVRPAIPANANPPITMRMPMSNPANTVPPPVYHTINGYRIDLHTAAQQGTYRLPNGKLIQVRKQAPTAAPAPTQPPNVTISRGLAPKPSNTYFNPVSVGQNPPARMTNGGSNLHINLALQQQQQLQEQRLQQQRQQQQQQQMLQQRQQQLMLQAQAQAQAQAGQPQPTIVAGQPNPALQLPTLAMLQNMVNGPHEDSPLGKSRKNFEGKLLSGVEICQHIVNKINTLTNSNSFKNIRNVRDLKELYIHVSYLLTYAIGRFKTLQEKCVDDVKKMGFTKESDFVMMGDQISNRNPDEDKSDDEDDCEIIEQSTTLIELDSEDEDDSNSKKKKDGGASKDAPCPVETEAAVAALLQEKDDANTLTEVISVDSMPQISAVEGNVSLETISSADADANVEKTSTEESTKEAVDGEASAEATEAEKSKNDDDLVEIIEGDENEALKDDGDKAEEGAAASKDGDEADDVVEIIEAGEDGEPQEPLEKGADEAEVEEKKDSVDEEKVDEIVEEKQQEKKVDDEVKEVEEKKAIDETNEVEEKKHDDEVKEVEQKKDSVEDDKMEQVAEEKQESDATALVDTEEASKEVEDVELKTAEAEQTTVVESVDGSKVDESENKENESPEVKSAEETENADAVVEKEADKEEAESEKLVESEKMEVDAQKHDEAESRSAKELINEEENCGESQDIPAPEETVNDEPATVSDTEPETNQPKDKAPADEPMTEVEEPKSAENEAPAPESTDESETASPDEPAATTVDGPVVVEPAVEDIDEVSEDAPEAAPLVEERPAEVSLADEAPAASTEDIAEVPSLEEVSVAETTKDESPVVEEAESIPEMADPIGLEAPTDELLDVPMGNELLAQIEDSFQKLQEMIDSTDGVTEETNGQQPTEAETPAGDEQMEVDDDETAAASEEPENSPSEQQQVQSADESESNDAPMVEDEESVECNGVLAEENGTSSSGDSQDAPETVPTEIGKTAAAEFESVNSPEMISGDC